MLNRQAETSRHTFYDPDTFRLLVRVGERINGQKAARLRELGFFEVAITDAPMSPSPASSFTLPGGAVWQAFGRKHTADAKVCMVVGQGRVVINGALAAEYFAVNRGWRHIALKPAALVGAALNGYDIFITVHGAKRESERQPRAIAHALAGALVELQPEWLETLARAGYRWRRLRQEPDA